MKIGKIAGWTVGIIVLLGVISALGSGKDSNTLNVTNTGESTMATNEAANTSAPAEKITIKNSVYKPDQYMSKVVGEATNNDSVKHSMTLKATFYDADGKILGTGVGALNDVASGDTKTFELLVTDDVTGYKDMKVQVDTLI